MQFLMLFPGLCNWVHTIHREGAQFFTPFLDVCILLLRVCGPNTSLLNVLLHLLDTCFEVCFLIRYKWNFNEVALDRRLDYFESYWPFFAGFGKIFFK
jgi:hypothetical protein